MKKLLLLFTILVAYAHQPSAAFGVAYANQSACADTIQPRRGVTTLSSNFLREAPDFAAELGNQLLMGTPVEILADSSYWRKVKSPDPYTAWCVDLSVAELTESQFEEYIAKPKLICTAPYSAILAEPQKNAAAIRDFTLGGIVIDTGKSKGGYRQVMLASGETGYVKKRAVADFGKWAFSREASAENILKTAYQFLGVPYQWGGTSIKGVDCSGLTRMVWFMNGVLLPRNASQQARVGIPVEVPENLQAEDDLKNLLPGDLIFFGKQAETDSTGTVVNKERVTHVGIYIGKGRFIHASKYVRINSLLKDDPDWYELSGTFLIARRIIGCGEDEGVLRIENSPAYFPQSK